MEDDNVESDLDNVIDLMPWRLRNQILNHLEDEEIKKQVAKRDPQPKRGFWKTVWRVTLYTLAVLWAIFWMPFTILLFISLIGIPFGFVMLLVAGWPLATLLEQRIWLYHTGEKSFRAYKKKHLNKESAIDESK